ncbi:MAG TPA: sigma-70 family RNA polymerase sigma factor [Polyangiaceae bacterium]
MTTEDTRRAYIELEGRLRPFIARRVPAADVDDVVQDVFLRVQRSLPSLRDEQSLTPWLYQVARSAVAERHRQQGRQPEPVPEEELELELPPEDTGPSPLEAELASYLLPLISRLPSPYREALTLIELEGMTQQAAANALGISLSGMKSRVQRGREKLRESLEACCRVAVDARGTVIECVPKQPSTCRCENS